MVRIYALMLISVFLVSTKTIDNEYQKLRHLVDDVLLEIEKAVQADNFTHFENFHTENFDSKAWYKRYLENLTDEERKSYTILRFGKVKVIPEGVKIKFSESFDEDGRVNGIIKSFDAILVKDKKNNIGYSMNDIYFHI